VSGAMRRMGEALAGLRPAEVEAFLRELLTPGEFHDLALRWELVELLAAGVSQRTVAARLGISLCKITRGARIMKKRNGIVAGLVAPGPAKVRAAGPAKAVRKVEGKHGTRVARKS